MSKYNLNRVALGFLSAAAVEYSSYGTTVDVRLLLVVSSRTGCCYSAAGNGEKVHLLYPIALYYKIVSYFLLLV